MASGALSRLLMVLAVGQMQHYEHRVSCSKNAEDLHLFLMETYSKLIRPVETNEEALAVSLELQLLQLIGVDEVNQVITINVNVKQIWRDYKLRWDPERFGGMETITLPSDSIWLPDVVLYDNAEGHYQITQMTSVDVNSSGFVHWEPPAIYKSYCKINVHNFPYDKQNCTMKFGSWTFDAALVDLMPSRGYLADSKIIPIGMDLSEYKPSIEWDILEVSAMRNKLVYAYGTYVDITFRLVIRRKTLFYTVNLMIPCVLISFLTIFVFYLPCDSGEKVTLCISILLSLTVFVLLLAKIIPPTSDEVPLLGRYLLFTLVVTTMSIALTIIVINIHFRNPSTHKMSPWVRKLFLTHLPKLLMIERPSSVEDLRNMNSAQQNAAAQRERVAQNLYLLQEGEGFASPRSQKKIGLSPEVRSAVKGINFIVEHVRDANHFGNTVRDWKYVALVLDRLFLWIFAVVCIVGTGAIVLNAPPLYETDEPIPRVCLNPEKEDRWICIFATNEE